MNASPESITLTRRYNMLSFALWADRLIGSSIATNLVDNRVPACHSRSLLYFLFHKSPNSLEDCLLTLPSYHRHSSVPSRVASIRRPLARQTLRQNLNSATEVDLCVVYHPQCVTRRIQNTTYSPVPPTPSVRVYRVTRFSCFDGHQHLFFLSTFIQPTCVLDAVRRSLLGCLAALN